MPFPKWLRLPLRKPDVPKTPSPHAAPPGTIEAVVPHQSGPNTSGPNGSGPNSSVLESSGPDNAVRMHIAASDPDFPTKREAAVNAILAAMDRVAEQHGFTKKTKSWAKVGPLGLVSLHLQRSRFGFEAYVNLGFQPLSEDLQGPWAQDPFVRLGRFYPAIPDTANDQDALIYLDVQGDSACLDPAMTILSDRALPWLLAHLTDPDAHAKPFLPGPAPVE